MSTLKGQASSFMERIRNIGIESRHAEAEKITKELHDPSFDAPDRVKLIYHEELHSFILIEDLGENVRPLPLAFAPCHAATTDYYDADARVEDLFEWTTTRIQDFERREHEKKLKFTKDARCDWLYRMIIRMREMTLDEMLTSDDPEARLLGTIAAGAELKESL